MKDVVELLDPVKKQPLKFLILKPGDIEVPSYQRDVSEALVRQLETVIDELGYIHPIVVVENGKGKYYVIDGQHRLLAVRNLGVTEIFAIVVPEELAQKILKFNTEKPPTIRDKAKQAYRLYMEVFNENPDLIEEELHQIIPEAFYITLGVTLEEKMSRFPAGFYDDFLKKIDYFLRISLTEAIEERRKRADALIELNDVLSEKYAELGLDNPLLKGELLRKAVQQAYGMRVRTISAEFYEAVEEVKKALKNISSL